MANPDETDLRDRLQAFVDYRRVHLIGDEKGEAQVFLDRLFRAFGHAGVREAGAVLETRLRRRDRAPAFADLIWKPRVLIEMKKARRDLQKDYDQALEYWIRAVPNRPAYVVLCNFDEFWIYDFNNQMDGPVDRVLLDGLPQRAEALAFLLPDEKPPIFLHDIVEVNRSAAAELAMLFNGLIKRSIPRADAQRFILQTVMALFSEDIGLLPSGMFTRTLDDAAAIRSGFDLIFGALREMNTPGTTPSGRYKGTPYFNGGLYANVSPFELEPNELDKLQEMAYYDWTAVRPEIFGTLFEQSLDKDERHAFGAHFTHPSDIHRVVYPTIIQPWREAVEDADTIARLTELQNRLMSFKVLDPACGCGNFLYMAYRALRRLEKMINERIDHLRRGPNNVQARFTLVSPNQFFGIDVNPFAVEIAKMTLMLARKLAADELGDELKVLPLDHLESNFHAADALAIPWPAFDACIGNPPYLGRRRIIKERGAKYSAWLSENFPDVGGVSDYVVYWFRKAHDNLPMDGRAGLVGTKTIKQGASRKASLDYILDHGGVIYDAVSGQPWSGDATVEVAIVNWGRQETNNPKVLWLSGGNTRLELPWIPSSLSPAIDLRTAADLRVNQTPKRCFQGQTPGRTRAFVLKPDEAAGLVRLDPTLHQFIHSYLIGKELNGDGAPQRFVLDIPADDLLEAEKIAPLGVKRARQLALPERQAAAEKEKQSNAELLASKPNARVNDHHQVFLSRWWQLGYRRRELLDALKHVDRYIALSRVAVLTRQSVYAFVSSAVRPGDAVQAFVFDDEYSLGILHSTLHRLWFEERCSTFRRDPRYTSTTVFNSFPWPQGPDQSGVEGVSRATEALLHYREEQLSHGVSLGRQYDSLREPGRNNLRSLHAELDEAVLVAYGFDPSEDLLAQLLGLNLAIASEERSGSPPWGPGNAGYRNTRRTNYKIEPLSFVAL